MAQSKVDLPVATSWVEGFRLLVELVRTLVWPAILIGAFIAFRQPIQTIAEELPLKFSAATKVSVGSLVLEIQQQAKATGNPQIAMLLGKLAPEAIKLLLETGRNPMGLVGKGPSDTFSIPDEKNLKVIKELQAHGLVDSAEDIDGFLAWVYGGRFHFQPNRSDLGHQTFQPTTPLLPPETDRLNRQSYKLNSLGKMAWQAVLDAVLEQLRAQTTTDGMPANIAQPPLCKIRGGAMP